jgi:hypothetical protein
MNKRVGVIAGTLIAVMLLSSCGDSTAPRQSARMAPNDGPRKNVPVQTFTDWWQCVSFDGGNTYERCDYTGYTVTYSYIYMPAEGALYTLNSPIDCSASSSVYCNNFVHGIGTANAYTIGDQLLVGPGVDNGDDSPIDAQCPHAVTSNSTTADSIANILCARTPPAAGGLRQARIRDALNRMNALGGTCAALASVGLSLLSHNKILIFADNNPVAKAMRRGAQSTPGAGTSGHIAISAYWTDVAFDNAHYTTNEIVHRTVQQLLAHELDHVVYNTGHTPTAYSTPHSELCKDVPY